METENECRVTVDPNNSCELSINAKGKWSGKVKAYATTIDYAYNLAIPKAELLEKQINIKNQEPSEVIEQ